MSWGKVWCPCLPSKTSPSLQSCFRFYKKSTRHLLALRYYFLPQAKASCKSQHSSIRGNSCRIGDNWCLLPPCRIWNSCTRHLLWDAWAWLQFWPTSKCGSWSSCNNSSLHSLCEGRSQANFYYWCWRKGQLILLRFSCTMHKRH